MVINKVTKVKLQVAYESIIAKLNENNICYETENNIIQKYDPTKTDDEGNPLPKPVEGSEGTGTAWIKCYFKDRKQVYIYFCCHLVDCLTCDYNRFITVYNYTDDSIDTNLLGMTPITAIRKYPEDSIIGPRPLEPNTLYYKSYTKSLTFIDSHTLYTEPVYTSPLEPYKEFPSTIEQEPVYQEEKLDVTVYKFYADFYRDEEGNLKELTPYNTDMVAIQDIKDIDNIDDADNKLFVLPIFNEKIDEQKILKFEFYQTNHKSPTGKYIPMNIIKYIPGYVDDLTGTNGVNKKIEHVTDENADTLLTSVLNYTRHCFIKTFIDLKNITSIWDFITYKDRNFPIIPVVDKDILIANNSHYIDFSFDDQTKNNFSMNTYFSNLIGTHYDTLDGQNLLSSETFISTLSEKPIKNDTIYNVELDSSDAHNSSVLMVNKYNNSKYGVDFKIAKTYCAEINIRIRLDDIVSTSKELSTEYEYKLRVNRYSITALLNNEKAFKRYGSMTEDYYDTIIKIAPEKQLIDGVTTYVWPQNFEQTITIPFITLDTAEPFRLELFIETPNISKIFTSQYLTLNMTCVTNTAKPISGEDLQRTYNLLPIEYNMNGISEGAYKYYQPKYHAYINGFVTYPYTKYNDTNLISFSDIDTYEIQQSYNKQYFNFIKLNKIKSIYRKRDTRKIYLLCPECKGDKKIACKLCNKNRYITYYKWFGKKDNIFNIRFNCPNCKSTGVQKLKDTIYDRCTCCAGTGDEIEYLFYNCYEFKDLSIYNGKTPIAQNLNIPPTVEQIKQLMVRVTKGTEKYTWPYLNYLLFKYFEINAGTTIDSQYDEYYKVIMNNIVFYKYNGSIAKYYFWTGTTHIEVPYGYNYIYSVKAITQDDWINEQKTAHMQNILYKVIPNSYEVDNLVGFYTYNIGDITKPGFNSFERIYFDREYIYNNIHKYNPLKDYNQFVENSDIIYTDCHIHDDSTNIVEELCETCHGTKHPDCPTCNGTGKQNNEICPTCNGSGLSNANCQECNGTGVKENVEKITITEKYIYKYVATKQITADNISIESDHSQTPKVIN